MSRVGLVSARLGVAGKGAIGAVEKMHRLVEDGRDGLSPCILSQPLSLLPPPSKEAVPPPPPPPCCSIHLPHRGSWIIPLAPLIPSAERDKPHFIKKTSMTVIRYNVCYTEQNEQKKKICSQAIIMGVIFQPISKKYLRNPQLHPLS